MSKFYLLGDSIRGNYMPRVKAIFDAEYEANKDDVNYDKVEVYGPEENCRFADYTLNSLRFWYEDIRSADVIHWNNGIWDIYDCCGEGRAYTPLAEYLICLRRIYSILRRENPKAPIIFATTTPTNQTEQVNRDTPRYNAEAVKLLTKLGAYFDDLYSVVENRRAEYICSDNTHLSEDGAKACALSVVEAYKKYRAK